MCITRSMIRLVPLPMTVLPFCCNLVSLVAMPMQCCVRLALFLPPEQCISITTIAAIV
jgi:hypothetical protein